MHTELLDMLRARKRGTLVLAGVNILVFIILSLMGDTQDARFMYRHGASFAPAVQGGEQWRLATAMFLHFNLAHLLYNMLGLLTLGDTLERTIGTVRFLAVYLGGGLLGNAVSVLAAAGERETAVSAGASGGIFAVIGALIWCVIRRGGRLGGIRLDRMLLMAALMAAQGFLEGGVDNAAHIGGMAGGFLLAVLLCRFSKHGKR